MSHAVVDQFKAIVDSAVVQLQETLQRVDPQAVQALLSTLQAASRIGCYGVGREGLAVKGFAMRLYHLGLQVSVVGEMTAAALGPGDVLLLSAGPGYFSTAAALAKEARRAGAQVVAITSSPLAQLQVPADVVVQIPATCLPPAAAEEDGEPGSAPQQGGQHPAGAHPTSGSGGQLPAVAAALPMGSSYELAMQLFFDAVCLLLQSALGVPEEAMRQRHTNME